MPQRFMRSSKFLQDPKKVCFFCDKGEVNGKLHEVRSSTVNERILRTVEKSSNDLWKVKLQPITLNSASAIGVKYHNNCYIKLYLTGNGIEGQPKKQDKCQGDRRDNLQEANDHFFNLLDSSLILSEIHGRWQQFTY